MGQDVESKVQELESRYRLLADNLIDAIWVLDVAEERYDFITPSVVKLSGETAEKFKQYTLKQIMTPESYKQAKQVMESGVANYEQGQHRLPRALFKNNGI